MFKWTFVIIFVVINTSFGFRNTVISEKNEYLGQTIQTDFDKNDKYFTNMYKQISYYDISNNLVKIELFLSENNQKQNGIVRQIQYISNGSFAYKFDVYFTKNRTDEIGFDMAVDLVDEKDNLIYTDYYYKKMNKYRLYPDSPFGDIPFKTLSFYEKQFSEEILNYKKVNPKAVSQVIDSLLPSGKTIVSYKNKISDLDADDKEMIRILSSSLDKNNFFSMYKNKIMVYENNHEYWILMQTQVMNFIREIKNYTNILLFYRYAGGFRGKAIFLGVDYEEFILEK